MVGNVPPIFCDDHLVGQVLESQPELAIVEADVEVAVHIWAARVQAEQCHAAAPATAITGVVVSGRWLDCGCTQDVRRAHV